MKNKDNIFDILIFICGCLLGFFIYNIPGISIKINSILFIIICGILANGVFRLFLPYSRMSLNVIKKADMDCNQVCVNAFKTSIALRLRFKKCIRLYHNNQFRRALKRLDKLHRKIKNDSDRFSVCFFSGLCCYHMRMYADAIDEFEICMSIQQNDIVAANLSNTYAKNFEYDKAEKSYLYAIKLNPNNLYALYGLARLYLETHEYEKSIRYCNSVIDLNDSLHEIYEIIALSYAALYDFDNCIRYCEILRRHDKRTADNIEQIIISKINNKK